ncbi:MAG: hypothetical protein JO340_20330 [Acidobacteriaceae bacterium]|nr:hypothetical protein [Acidobacteriaceae bacterium]
MSKQDEAELILKLYDLRREATMRKARDWYFAEFNPQSMADVASAMFSEHGAYVRMVWSYWDMAAALVNYGSLDMDLFNSTNYEHLAVFSKIEVILADARAHLGPQLLVNLEKLIDATPDGRKKTEMMRERMKEMGPRIAAARAAQTANRN